MDSDGDELYIDKLANGILYCTTSLRSVSLI